MVAICKTWQLLVEFNTSVENCILQQKIVDFQLTSPSIPAVGTQEPQLLLPPRSLCDSLGHSTSIRRPRLIQSYTPSGSVITTLLPTVTPLVVLVNPVVTVIPNEFIILINITTKIYCLFSGRTQPSNFVLLPERRNENKNNRSSERESNQLSHLESDNVPFFIALCCVPHIAG